MSRAGPWWPSAAMGGKILAQSYQRSPFRSRPALHGLCPVAVRPDDLRSWAGVTGAGSLPWSGRPPQKVKDDADRNTGPLGTGGAGLRFVSGRSAFRPENLRCPRVSRSTPRPPELRQTASGPEMVAVSRARRMTPAKVGPGRRPARSGCWSREPRVPGPVLRRRLLNERPLAAGQTWRRAALRLCLTSSRTGLTCSPVVAEGDAYPP